MVKLCYTFKDLAVRDYADEDEDSIGFENCPIRELCLLYKLPVALYCGHILPKLKLYVLLCEDPVLERFLPSELRSSVNYRDSPADLREIKSICKCCITAPDDDDILTAEEGTIAGCAVAYALPLILLFSYAS